MMQPTTRKRVLIADDEPELRALLRDTIEDRYDVFEAADGKQAIDLAERTRPDAVLLDIRMPGTDGLAVCRWLKSSPPLAAARVIITSGMDGRGRHQPGLDLGADYYLPKPFTPEALRRLLQIACSL
jgi:CheY-like chemotaxis protein